MSTPCLLLSAPPPGHMQPRNMAAVRTRGTTIAGLDREGVASIYRCKFARGSGSRG
jgi:hypothetical protein